MQQIAPDVEAWDLTAAACFANHVFSKTGYLHSMRRCLDLLCSSLLICPPFRIKCTCSCRQGQALAKSLIITGALPFVIVQHGADSYVLQVAPELHTNAPFSHIQFSADGKLMLCVAEGHVYQLDAFNGSLQHSYSTGVPQGTLGLGAIFSPDSNFILSGMCLGITTLMIQACGALHKFGSMAALQHPAEHWSHA